jgi:hypothetical protein
VLQVLIHIISFLFKAGDLHLTGCDVPLELLDLIVEHELELLELLCLLLKLIDLLFSVTDKLVLRTDFRGLVLDLLLEGLQDFALIRDLNILFLLVTLKLLNVAFEILVLVLGQLEFGLGLQGHILHISLVLHVLLVDFIDFEFCVSSYLSKSLLVILTDLSDVVTEGLSGVFCSLHVLAELLKFLCNTLVVLLHDAIHLLFVFKSLLFLLSLEFLIVGSIGKHLLRISLPLELQFSLTLFGKLADFLFF